MITEFLFDPEGAAHNKILFFQQMFDAVSIKKKNRVHFICRNAPD